MHYLDCIVVITYLLAVLLIGWYRGKYVENIADYAVGRKKYSDIVLFCTLLATTFSGSNLFGPAQDVFKSGILLILPPLLWIVGLFVISEVIAPRSQRFLHYITGGEVIEAGYGASARILSGILSFIHAAGLIAIQIGVIGTISTYMFHIPEFYGLLIGFGVVVGYTSLGGARAVVFTDVFQLIFMAIAIPMLCTEAFNSLGYSGFGEFFQKIKDFSPRHLDITLSPNDLKKYLPLVIIYSIPSLSPILMQRVLMAKNPQQLQKVYRATGCAYIPLVFIIAMFGLIALLKNPSMDSAYIVPYLVEELSPPFIKGIYLTGILAVLMSSADSHLNAGSSSLAHDVFKPILGEKLSVKKELILARVITVVIGIAGIFIVYYYKRILSIYLLTKQFWMPVMPLPLIALFFGYKTSTRRFFAAGIAGLITVFSWKKWITPTYHWDPTLPALIVNALIFFNWWKLPQMLLNYTQKTLFSTSKTAWGYVTSLPKLIVKKVANLPHVLSNAATRSTQEIGDHVDNFFLFMFAIIVFPFFIKRHIPEHHQILLGIKLVTGMCSGFVMLRSRWPEKWYPYWPIAWYLTLLLCLPCLGTFCLLEAGGDLYSLLSFAMFLAYLALLTEWRWFLGLSAIGIPLGFLIFSYVCYLIPAPGRETLLPYLTPENLNIFIYVFVAMIGGISLFSIGRAQRNEYRIDAMTKTIDTLAHELGNPVTISWHIFSDLNKILPPILEGYKKAKDAQILATEDQISDKQLQLVPELLEINTEVLNRTLKTIDLLVANAKIRKEQLDGLVMQNYSMIEVVQEALKSYPYRTEDQREKIAVKLNHNFEYSGSDILMIQVLQNLIKNALQAIEFADKGKIKIWSRDSARYNFLYVEDDAIGLDPKDARKIFNRFISNKPGGLGIGLNFCQEALYKMDAEIWCESEAGKFTRFCMSFPKTKDAMAKRKFEPNKKFA